MAGPPDNNYVPSGYPSYYPPPFAPGDSATASGVPRQLPGLTGYYTPSVQSAYPNDALQQMLDRNAGASGNPAQGIGANAQSPMEFAGNGGNPNEPPSSMSNQYNPAALRNQPVTQPVGASGQKPVGAAAAPKTWRDYGIQSVDSKLGQGFSQQFKAAHGVDPLEFYTDPRNWFPYQKQAAQDYGQDSTQFRDATVRAAVDEGLMHQAEAEEWRQKHGDTPISDDAWKRWYYLNRNGNPNNEPLVV